MNCITCQKETNNPKFCSKSCAAKHNNLFFPKRKKSYEKENKCLECGKNVRALYCNTICMTNFRTRLKINEYKNGIWNGGDKSLSKTIRNYLLQNANYSCQKCGFNKPHPTDERSILEINHIDGNATNHDPSNLEVLCPNCHAMTDTYRARNRGNGRLTEYIRRVKQSS